MKKNPNHKSCLELEDKMSHTQNMEHEQHAALSEDKGWNWCDGQHKTVIKNQERGTERPATLDNPKARNSEPGHPYMASSALLLQARL